MADIILSEKDIARFWAKTKRNPERMFNGTACIEWTGQRTVAGYGRISRLARYAHRAAWTLAHGPVPPGLCVLHNCDNPPCVNVLDGHLFIGTKRDNTRDMVAKGRAKGATRKTHCPAGHPYAGENLRIKQRPRGGEIKVCRTCHLEQQRERRRKNA